MTKKIKPQTLKGFRDFYPEEMVFRNWLFEKAREVSQRFGYQEYEGPALEKLSLYEAKSGEELVKEQTFILTDRRGRKLALRPELTPTLARMVAQKREELVFPIRWFSIGPRWRYEKPQKGRYREFWQWDVDLIGADTPEADAEIIAVACEFFKEVGLTDKEVLIKVNNRRLMEQKLDLIEVKKGQRPQVFRAIDKKDKMDPKKWEEYLQEIGLTPLQIKDLKGILKDKDFAGESEELTTIFSTLADLGFSSYVEFDPTVVRGLDYYTGTVFEAQDRKGEFRAILGGGRYDNLVEVVGGPKLPGVGFAAGDAILEKILKKYQKIPSFVSVPTKVLITIFDERFYRESLKIAKVLRDKGVSTEVYLTLIKLDKQLKYADRKGIPYAVIIGPDEAKNKTVTIKDLKTGKQKTVPQKELSQQFN